MSVPSPPVIMVQPAGSLNRLEFYWSAPINNGQMPVIYYTLKCPALGFQQIYNPTVYHAIVPISTNSVNYVFNISATNRSGESQEVYYNRASAGHPPTINTVSVVNVSTYTAIVTWVSTVDVNQQNIHNFSIWALPSTAGNSTLFFSQHTYLSSYKIWNISSSSAFMVQSCGSGSLYGPSTPSTLITPMIEAPKPITFASTLAHTTSTVVVGWTGSKRTYFYTYRFEPDDPSYSTVSFFNKTPYQTSFDIRQSQAIETPTLSSFFIDCKTWPGWATEVTWYLTITATNDGGIATYPSTVSAIIDLPKIPIHLGPNLAVNLVISNVTKTTFQVKWDDSLYAVYFFFSLDAGITKSLYSGPGVSRALGAYSVIWYWLRSQYSPPESPGGLDVAYAVFSGLPIGSTFTGTNGALKIIGQNDGGITGSKIPFPSITLLPGDATSITPSAFSQTGFTLTWGGMEGATGVIYSGTAGQPSSAPTFFTATYTGLSEGTVYTGTITPYNVPYAFTTPYAITTNTQNGASQSITVKTSPGTPVSLSQSPGVGTSAPNSFTLVINWLGAFGAEYFSYKLDGGAIISCGSSPITITGLNADTAHYVTIIAFDTGWAVGPIILNTPSANSGPFYTGPAAPILNKPTGFTATQTSITMTWNNVPSATSYTSAITPAGGTVVITGTSATFSGLSPGGVYSIIIRSVNQYGTTPSDPKSYATSPAPPVPSWVSSTDVSETFTWTQVAGLTYTYTTTPATSSGTITAPYTVTGLTANTSYIFNLTATNPDGNSATGSTSGNFTGPTKPIITLGTPTDSTIPFTFTDGIGTPPATFMVYWTPTDGGGSQSASGNSGTITGLKGNKTYTVYMVATNTIYGTTGPSTTAKTLPGPPVPFIATPATDTTVSIGWDYDGTVTYTYDLSSTTPGANGTGDGLSAPSSPINLTGLTPSAVYSIIIYASTTASAPLPFTMLPTAPSITVEEGTPAFSSLNVSWDAADGADQYVVYWYTGSGTPSNSGILTGLTYAITGLASSTTYNVYAVSKNSSTGRTSANSAIKTGTTALGPPTAPDSFLRSAITDTAFTLAWGIGGNYSATGSATDHKYQLLDPANAVISGGDTYIGSWSNTRNFSALTFNTLYRFYIVVKNSTGEAPADGLFTGSPQISALTAPEPFSSCTIDAASVTTSSFDVAWVGGSGGTLTLYVNSVPRAVTTSPFTVTGLGPFTDYSVYLTSSNAGATGGGTQTSSTATTKTKIGPPGPPVITNVTPITSTAFTVLYTPSGGRTYTYSISPSENTSQGADVQGSRVTFNVQPGTVYTFSVTAVEDRLDPPATATSASVTILTLPAAASISIKPNSVTSSAFSIIWDDITGASNYTYALSTSPSGTPTTGATTSMTQYDFTGTPDIYYVIINANNSRGSNNYGGGSVPSNQVMVVMPPTAPTGLSSSSITSSSFIISWTGGSLAATSFSYTLSAGTTTTNRTGVRTPPPAGGVTTGSFGNGGTRTITFSSGLFANTLYDIIITAVNSAGTADSTTFSLPYTGPDKPTVTSFTVYQPDDPDNPNTLVFNFRQGARAGGTSYSYAIVGGIFTGVLTPISEEQGSVNQTDYIPINNFSSGITYRITLYAQATINGTLVSTASNSFAYTP